MGEITQAKMFSNLLTKGVFPQFNGSEVLLVNLSQEALASSVDFQTEVGNQGAN